MSKNCVWFHCLHCIACVPVSHAYIFVGRTIFFPTKLPAIGYINLLFITLCIVRHAFIGSLTLREMKTALWDARAKWMSLGNVLSLPIETLQVIEGHACRLPSALYNYGCIHVLCKYIYRRAGNFRGVKNSFNSKTVIFMSKIHCLLHCITCFLVNHAYVFVGENFVEVSLPTKIMNFLHENYPLHNKQECMHEGE